MDFAKNILHKYGWREGDGLGKNSDGIVKPIKANFKFNNSGLGTDQAKDHTNRWWERVFDEAANNLDVGPAGKIRQKEHDAVEISANSYSVKKLKQKTADGKANYGGFLKASRLLTAVGREEELEGHVKTEDIEFKPTKVLTDEELFAACGGRTAHKGARHGLKLSGKLARIEAQNSKLLQELESKSFEKVIQSNEWQQVQKKKKSKKKKHDQEKWNERHGAEEEDECKDMVHHADYVVKKNKKKAKADRRLEADLADELDTSMGFFEKLEEDDGTVPDPGPSIEEEVDDEKDAKLKRLDSNSVRIKKKSKKNRKQKQPQPSAPALEDDDAMDPQAPHRKDYKPEQKRNNKLLRETVEHEFKTVKLVKPKKLLKSDSEASDSADEQDVVERINKERLKLQSKLPKIKVTEVQDQVERALAESFKEKHRYQAKRIGKHSVKRKKSKKEKRAYSQLTKKLEQTL
ncbi:G patch domain containing 4 [Culex quinquefasciatus]|uniref:G patch domain-containing protein 4 n=1 Tax=Culex quinquefasciatus TaxID=7176 RepID=B0WGQ8_CULQU|nr:G patch domain containing 4 [Culex quinquefasciatus]|eukprot:XP_001847892.1 G patch domain containing 4 [Culex quinquefasciatus]